MFARPYRPARRRFAAGLLVLAVVAGACSSDGGDSGGGDAAAATDLALFDSSALHEVTVSYDEEDYDAMIQAYVDSGDKEWIEATVTIDGTTYEQVGLRLKGNSSLMSLRGGAGGPGGGAGGPGGGGDARAARPAPQAGATTTTAPPLADTTDSTAAASEPSAAASESTTTTAAAAASESTTTAAQGPARQFGGGVGGPGGGASAEEPEKLPWLIRLDEYVDGQEHQGYRELVIRSNSSETALNEAVALELLDQAGLASEKAIPTSFSINGGDPLLRLAVEHPNDDWQEANFEGDGALYKAESGGDYSYRGDDPDAYVEIFDQEAGEDVADLTPLIEFLQFINESDDATFAAELPERLDVDAFASYLAAMDVIANSDDIDGPGNNSYLHYDADTGVFTIVPWDMNLAFGAMGGMGGGRGGMAPEGFEPPDGADGFQPPEGFDPGADGGPGGFGRSNILVERFHANAEFEALYQAELTELRASLYGSGAAAEVLQRWTTVLSEQATHLVDQQTIDEEAASISAQFTA